ncbi:MAG: hypothetical protein V3V00_09750 [Saprospiraceae bacterium]
MRYNIILLLAMCFLIIISSCNTESKESSTINVAYKGALKNIMHKGDISAKADLQDFQNGANLYALGAIENLKGEIQIFDSQPFNTEVIDNTMVIDSTFSKKATLLVYASVSHWNTTNIPDKIVTYDDLENYILQVANHNQIVTDEPFPFIIEGEPKSFNWHIINWNDGDKEHSHEKHISSGLHGTSNNKEVQMLGFYSDSHHAIFTHHTTNMHIHVKTKDEKIAGHVDDLILGKGMTLKLPHVKLIRSKKANPND